MIRQFDARYRVTVFSNKETTIVEYPITCKFTVTRGTFSQSNSATIQLYNLAPSTRNQIFQDQWTNAIDKSKWKYVHLEAGWGNTVSLIFRGRIMQAYSYKSGGQTDVITEIQAVALDIFDYPTSHTFAAGTSFRDALKTIASDMPNVAVGNIGAFEGTFQSPTTFDGLAMEEISKHTGGHAFVDNGLLNVLMDNEVIDVPVPVISDDTVLLETPMRRDANLEVKTLFLPDLIAGQLVEVKSSVQTQFNGQYKLVGFTHDCLISPTQAGSRTTQLVLWIGPLLPGANIALTGGAAPVSFNKVKGEDVSPVNPMPLSKKWIMPCNGRIVGKYGEQRSDHVHNGIDIAVPINTKVKAIADGKVIAVGAADGYGYWVKLDHGKINGKQVTSEYGHINSWNVSYGQKIKQGTTIALSGNRGRSQGPHLHLTIRENGTGVNPYKYINSGSEFRGAGASGGW